MTAAGLPFGPNGYDWIDLLGMTERQAIALRLIGRDAEGVYVADEAGCLRAMQHAADLRAGRCPYCGERFSYDEDRNEDFCGPCERD